VLILAGALAIGWRPDASPATIMAAPLLILLGTAAFGGLALLMAETLRAEATLAAVNLVYILLLGLGGVVFPLTKFPAAARPVLELLPTGALSTGLRTVLQYVVAFPVGNTITLSVLAATAITLAARTFQWD
jgi:ABC-2 type transport system permease protein